MYYRMFVSFDRSIADSSIGARLYVANKLEGSALDDIPGFNNCDSFSIGGHWSGILTTRLLNQEKFFCFVKEVKQTYGWELERSTLAFNRKISEKKKDQAAILFFKYFPDFNGELPFFRDENETMGYEDDASIVENERAFYKWLGVYEGYSRYGSEYDGIECIDLNDTIISPENTIGKKWVVVVSCHH